MVDERTVTREGIRVRLRPVRDDDLDELVPLANDEGVARWTDLPHPYERGHAAKVIALAHEELRLGQSAYLAVCDVDSDELMGMTSLANLDLESKNGEVGIWLGRPYWGNGLAMEAFDLLLEIAYQRLDLTKLFGVVLEGNEASVNLFERFGFQEEGRLRWHTKRDEAWMDKIFYGLLREEWERRVGRG